MQEFALKLNRRQCEKIESGKQWNAEFGMEKNRRWEGENQKSESVEAGKRGGRGMGNWESGKLKQRAE